LSACLRGKAHVGEVRNEDVPRARCREIFDDAAEDADGVVHRLLGWRSIEGSTKIIAAAVDDDQRAPKLHIGFAEESVDLTSQIRCAGTADRIVASSERRRTQLKPQLASNVLDPEASVREPTGVSDIGKAVAEDDEVLEG
jgi:hypothetical protein